MFLYNHWYVAAWSTEVGSQPLARTLLNEPVVLYRTADGKAVAMEDRCPHRRAPLSLGKVVDDRLQCHYHGLQFAPGGACVRIPGQERIPASVCVRTYPVEDRYRWVWIWMGNPDEADPDLIPDYRWMTDSAWGAKGDRYHVKANWQLIVDNLLDLTHLAFVHESTIGNAAVAESADVKVTRGPANVLVTRWIIDQPPPPTYAKVGNFSGHVDRWQFIDFTAPSFLRLHVGATPTGTGGPEGNLEGGIQMRNLNCITPETETTTHYFWAQAHNFDPHNQAVTDLAFEQVSTAFREDVVVFEAQQRVISQWPDSKEVDINSDAGGIQARRILARMHAAEQDARQTEPV